MLSSQRAWQNFYLRSGVRRGKRGTYCTCGAKAQVEDSRNQKIHCLGPAIHQFTFAPVPYFEGNRFFGVGVRHPQIPRKLKIHGECHFKKLGYAVQGLYNQIDSVSYCIRFYYFIFHFTTVYCISLCIVLYCIVLYCIVLYCTFSIVLHCILYYIALICKTILYNLYTYLIYNMMFYDHMYTCHVPIHG